MIIRKVNEKDFENIYELVKIAFQTAKVSDGTEQDFVYELRKRDTYIPELELVAEEENILIGHIMLSKQKIEKIENSENNIGLMLAPICVRKQDRKKGIGGTLIKEATRIAKELGYQAIFLIGDPNYYKRYGFRKITEFNLENTSDVPDEFILANELIPNALKEIKGKGQVNLH